MGKNVYRTLVSAIFFLFTQVFSAGLCLECANRTSTSQAPPLTVIAQWTKHESCFKYQLTLTGNDLLDVSLPGTDGRCLLSYLAHNGDLALLRTAVDWCVENHKSLDIVGSNGTTPLIEAMISGKQGECYHCKPRKKCQPCSLICSTCLREKSYCANCLAKKDACALYLIEKGADVNRPVELSEGFRVPGFTPLHFAAQEGRVDLVDRLLQAGAHITLNGGGVSPFHLAAARDQVKVLEVFRRHNIDITQPSMRTDQPGENIFHLAAGNDSTQSLNFLLENYPELLIKPLTGGLLEGLLPIDCALLRGSNKFLRAFCDKSAKRDIKVADCCNISSMYKDNDNRYGLLLDAVAHDYPDSVLVYLDIFGLQPETKIARYGLEFEEFDDTSLLEIAIYKRSSKVLKCLLAGQKSLPREFIVRLLKVAIAERNMLALKELCLWQKKVAPQRSRSLFDPVTQRECLFLAVKDGSLGSLLLLKYFDALPAYQDNGDYMPRLLQEVRGSAVVEVASVLRFIFPLMPSGKITEPDSGVIDQSLECLKDIKEVQPLVVEFREFLICYGDEPRKSRPQIDLKKRAKPRGGKDKSQAQQRATAQDCQNDEPWLGEADELSIDEVVAKLGKINLSTASKASAAAKQPSRNDSLTFVPHEPQESPLQGNGLQSYVTYGLTHDSLGVFHFSAGTALSRSVSKLLKAQAGACSLAILQRRVFNQEAKPHGDKFHQLPPQCLQRVLPEGEIFQSNEELVQFNNAHTPVTLENGQFAVVIPTVIFSSTKDFKESEVDNGADRIGKHRGATVALVKPSSEGTGFICTHLCFHEHNDSKKLHDQYKEELRKKRTIMM